MFGILPRGGVPIDVSLSTSLKGPLYGSTFGAALCDRVCTATDIILSGSGTLVRLGKAYFRVTTQPNVTAPGANLGSKNPRPRATGANTQAKPGHRANHMQARFGQSGDFKRFELPGNFRHESFPT
jgi:hypothetical protein